MKSILDNHVKAYPGNNLVKLKNPKRSNCESFYFLVSIYVD
jgi:hypothetical protein